MSLTTPNMQCKYCPETFVYGEQKDRHEFEEHVTVLYSCDTCQLYFTKHSRLKRHRIKKGCVSSVSKWYQDPNEETSDTTTQNPVLYVCHRCFSLFDERDSLTDHFAIDCSFQNRESSFSQWIQRYPWSQRRDKDQFLKWGQAIVSCDCGCQKRFKSIEDLTCHNNIKYVFSCDVCHLYFKYQEQLEEHLKHQHANKEKPATTCWKDESFIDCNDLRTGTNCCCDGCEKEFTTFQGLLKHRKRAHLEDREIFVCDCGQILSLLTELRQHQKTNCRGSRFCFFSFVPVLPVETSVVCSVCERRFVSRAHLQRHAARYHRVPFVGLELSETSAETPPTTMLTTTTTATTAEAVLFQKMTTCDVCQISFNSIEVLAQHWQTQHQRNFAVADDRSTVATQKKKRFRCEVCTTAFFHRQALYRHHRSAHPKSRFQHEPRPSFNFSLELDRPQKTNQGDKPYQCNTCAKQFRAALSLKIHTKMCSCHLCWFCSEQFENPRLGRAHYRQHITNLLKPLGEQAEESGE